MTAELAKLLDDAKLAIETLESPKSKPSSKDSSARWLESIGKQVSEIVRKEIQQ